MTTYRVGNHHGITICREGDGTRCGRPEHDCARGHLVAVVVEGGQEFAEEICAALNGESDLRVAYGAVVRNRNHWHRRALDAGWKPGSMTADPLCAYPDGLCTCGEPEGHRNTEPTPGAPARATGR